MTGDLTGMRCLLTGAANGIGLETARLMTARGASVAVLDRDGEAIAGLPALLGPGLAAGVAVDLLDDAGSDRAVAEAVEKLGGIDCLVNCAGIDAEKPLDAMSDAEWDRLMGINLRGPMRMCRAAFPHLKASGRAAIVNLSSAAGLSPLPNRTAYCASKAGIIMMSKTLAMEWAQHGIRVNVICPGAVDTALFRTSYENWPDPEARLSQIRSRYALGRIAEPRELAEAIIFLCSPAASYVTGIALPVDGGRSFH